MIAPTHITFAGFLYLLLLAPVGMSVSLANALLVVFASVLPDIDTPESTIGRCAPFISRRVERTFGHRTLTHSAAGMAALGVLALPLLAFNRECYVCFLAGYASHPFLDTMTSTGVKLFYPFSGVRCVFPLDVNNPHRYRVRTGGRVDKALGIFFALACVPTFFVAHAGYERFIRATQRSIEAAVRDYNEFSGDHLVFATISAYDMLSKERLEGTYPVAGALNAQTLLLTMPDGRLRSLGKVFQSEYVADHVLCVRGEPVRWDIRTIDLAGQVLGQLEEVLDSCAEGYCFGSLVLAEDVSVPEDPRLFRPVTARGSVLTLNYATMNDLDALGMDALVVLAGRVTLRARYADGGGGAAAPFGERFVHVGAVVAPGESLELLKHEGDTIAAGEIIARKGTGAPYALEADLNEEKIRMLIVQRSADAEAFDRDIMLALAAWRIDSSEDAATRKLLLSGYVAEGAAARASLKAEVSKNKLAAIERAKEEKEARAELAIRALKVANEGVRFRASSAEGRAAIRSRIAGVLVHVRDREVNGRRQIGFVVRSLRKE